MPAVLAPPPLPASRASRPLERLEAELVELASQLTAATARFLTLVGRYDAAEGWREWGMRSTAHWLSWKCGLSMTTGREQVRVARALRHLPMIGAAFGAGRLSYSKVRALTRFATPDTESALVELAEHATAAQVEQLRVAAARARTPDKLRARHAERGLTFRVDDDGTVTGSFRLSPEQAAVFLHALQAERDQLLAGEAEDPADAFRGRVRGARPAIDGRCARVDGDSGAPGTGGRLRSQCRRQVSAGDACDG